ncbi:MAG TPA: alpha/beta fold hydrolase [Opitutaceae bacterium]|nr:alpha/beta fold hydrolase [Opitutaceae bacterium]
MSSGARAWVTVPRPQPAARLRLVCLPHAGAGASSFFPWGAALQPAGIEVRSVQYPGRENRLAEACIDEAGAMVRALADAWPEISGFDQLTADGGGRCALYGHSMGSLLGFELAAELARRGTANRPEHLFLSGHNPPHLASRLPLLHTLPDGEFLPAVAKHYGNLPAELIADRELAALIAPILRADFKLVDEYRWRGAGPTPTPLTVLGGTNDPWTTEAELAEWSRHTRGKFQRRMFAGDHFFHQQNRAAVLELVQKELS